MTPDRNITPITTRHRWPEPPERAAVEAARLMPELPASVLRPAEHGAIMEGYARRIAALTPAIREACLPLGAACYGNGVPFASFAEATRFALGLPAGVDVGRTAAYMAVRRAAKLGAMAFGIRWRQWPDQPAGCRYRGNRRRIVRGLDSATFYQSLSAAAEHVSGTRERSRGWKAAYERIRRAIRSGRAEFGTRWALWSGKAVA